MHDSRVWERFTAKIGDTKSCWWWEGAHTDQGYGQFFLDGRVQYAHRVAWQMLVGPIPEGLHIDHLCRNRTCINPDHLEPVTPRENTRRGAAKFCDPVPARARREARACKRGHEYTPENTYILKATGHRYCRTCIKIRQRARREAKRDSA